MKDRIFAVVAFLVIAIILEITFPFVTQVRAQSARIFFSPESFEVEVGETYSVDVMVNTAEAEAVAITADFNYPQELLEATDINFSNSVFDQSVEADFSKPGIVYISRFISPNNEDVSFSGEGIVAKVSFLGIKDGEATLSLADTVELADTNAEPILAEVNEAEEITEEDTEENSYQMYIITGGFIVGVILLLFLLFTFFKRRKREIASGSEVVRTTQTAKPESQSIPQQPAGSVQTTQTVQPGQQPTQTIGQKPAAGLNTTAQGQQVNPQPAQPEQQPAVSQNQSKQSQQNTASIQPSSNNEENSGV